MPGADDLAALARSSSWRWATLRFTVSWPRDPWQTTPVRAWLRRPDRLRVETLDGDLLQVVHEPRSTGAGTTEDVPRPSLRPDGLVAERPRGPSYDDPMYQDYAWVAMLDPAELADGTARDDDALPGPPLVVGSVAEVRHAGRPAWEAVVVPTTAYEPRCGCCPLLRSRHIDLLEYRDDPERLLAVYPETFRVRLDVGTGVCVLTEELDGRRPGHGHDLRIEAVDDPMDDALFTTRRSWLRGAPS